MFQNPGSALIQIEISDMLKASDYTTRVRCSHFITSGNSAEIKINTISGYYDASGLYPGRNWIYLYCDAFNTIEACRNWLADQAADGNPVTIIYELAEPTTEQLTRTGDLYLEDGVNNVFNADQYAADLSMQYSPDGYNMFDWIYRESSGGVASGLPVLDADPTDTSIQTWINDSEEGGVSGITKIRVVLQSDLYADEGNGVYAGAKTVPWSSLPGFTVDNCGILGWTEGTASNAAHVITGKSELYPRISTSNNGITVLDRKTVTGSQAFYIYIYKIDDYINYG